MAMRSAGRKSASDRTFGRLLNSIGGKVVRPETAKICRGVSLAFSQAASSGAVPNGAMSIAPAASASCNGPAPRKR